MPNAKAPKTDYGAQTVFQNQARYNQRANQELFQHLSALTGRARRRDTGSWFGSIHGILNHVIICDINWLRRFRPLAPDAPMLNAPDLDPPNLSWDHDLHDNFSGLRDHRIRVDQLIRDWFDDFPESGYGDTFEYRDSAGETLTAMAGRAFEFLFSHQIHHRGQISQILDTIGLPNNLADNTAYLA